jgi:hypothetical protein
LPRSACAAATKKAFGGYEMAKANYLTGDEAKRILAGVSPVRIWREKRGLTQRALAQASGISAGCFNEIERNGERKEARKSGGTYRFGECPGDCAG